jgi:hypothetical protein
MHILSICEDNLSLIAEFLPMRSRILFAISCKPLYFTALTSPAAEYVFRTRCLDVLDQRPSKSIVKEESVRHKDHPSFETATRLYDSLRCPSWRALWYILCQYGPILCNCFRFLSEGNARGGIARLLLGEKSAQFQVVTRVSDIDASGRLQWYSNSMFSLYIHVYFVNGLPRKLICRSCNAIPRLFEVRSLRRGESFQTQWTYVFSEITENTLNNLHTSTSLPSQTFATWLFSLPKSLEEQHDARMPSVFALEMLPQTDLMPTSLNEDDEFLLCSTGLYWAEYGAHGKEILHVSIEDSSTTFENNNLPTHKDDKDEESKVRDEIGFVDSRSFFSTDFSISCDEAYECLACSCWPPPLVNRDLRPSPLKQAVSFIDSFPRSVVSSYTIDEDKDDDGYLQTSLSSASTTRKMAAQILQHEQLLPYQLSSLNSQFSQSLGQRRSGIRRTSEIACDPYSSSFFHSQGMSVLQRVSPGLRLVARKVIGDVNIPSGMTSFVANLSAMSESPIESITNEPVFAFNRQGVPFIYNLTQEPVMSIRRGIGFINFLPSSSHTTCQEHSLRLTSSCYLES